MLHISKAAVAAGSSRRHGPGPRSRRAIEPSREAQGRTPPRADADVAALFRYEPTGLSLLRPYRRGRIPVVLIHGLWSNPWSWARMIKELEADAALRDRYQFWTFGYSTGDPLAYSATLLRRDLDEVRRKFDPDLSDAAFNRMVLVGHSMGGLLAKMMVQESGTRLWRLVSDRPVQDLAGDQADCDLLRSALIFRPRPEVRRVVFIATPHRGSRVDRGGLERSARDSSACPTRSGRRTAGSSPATARTSSSSASARVSPRASTSSSGNRRCSWAWTNSGSRRTSRPIPSSRTGATRPVPAGATAWSSTRGASGRRGVRVARLVRPSVPGPSRRHPRGPADPRGACGPLMSPGRRAE